MAADALPNLLTQLHYLRNRAPHEYDKVLDAFNSWAGEYLARTTKVVPAELVQYQGKLQMIEGLIEILNQSKHRPPD